MPGRLSSETLAIRTFERAKNSAALDAKEAANRGGLRRLVVAILVHEVWEDSHGLPSLLLAGPDGDGARELLDKPAKLVRLFEAESHFEAMQIYYAMYGRGVYTTEYAIDHEPYRSEWAERQSAVNAR